MSSFALNANEMGIADPPASPAQTSYNNHVAENHSIAEGEDDPMLLLCDLHTIDVPLQSGNFQEDLQLGNMSARRMSARARGRRAHD